MFTEQLLNFLNSSKDVKITIGLSDLQRFIEENCKINEVKDERMFTVEEVATIFGKTKITVRNWYTSGILIKKQDVKNGSVKIPESSIEEMVKNQPKYSNAWINYNLIKNNNQYNGKL